MKLIQSLFILFIFIIYLTLIGCSGKSAELNKADQNKVTVQRYMQEFNKGNSDYLDDYMAPNYIYHGPDGDLNKESFKKFHNGMLAVFPDAKMTVKDIFASGDKVVTRWKVHGTQKGKFNGIEPTGKEVSVEGIIISKFKNGQAIEEWEQVDRLGMMQQLGVIPVSQNDNQ